MRSPAGLPATRRLVMATATVLAITLAQTAGADPTTTTYAFPAEFSRVPQPTANFFPPGGSAARWRAEVPAVEDVRITSAADGSAQAAMWLPPSEEGPRPLLVVLHSWSVGYDQYLGIPYAQWAHRQGWAMIHPDFRGRHDSPDATGSELAVSDIVDAVEFAKAHADIDETQVFITGFSGGGMMSLVMAGRHPDRLAGVVAWVPIYDLVEWYRYSARESYSRQIVASCNGDPLLDETARNECAARSPRAHLDAAREAGVPIYIGHGLGDRLVLPEQSVWAFNHLAEPGDQISAADSAAIAANSLPSHMAGRIGAETYFAAGDPAPLFSTRSGDTTLVLFEGGHTAVFNPGLRWMAERVAASQPSPKVEGAIRRLYRASLGRDSDTSGLSYWSSLYLSGRSLNDIAGQFMASREFRETYGSLDDVAFVRLLYRNVMGREADPVGLEHWTRTLASGRPRAAVLIGFSQSAELRQRTSTP